AVFLDLAGRSLMLGRLQAPLAGHHFNMGKASDLVEKVLGFCEGQVLGPDQFAFGGLTVGPIDQYAGIGLLRVLDATDDADGAAAKLRRPSRDEIARGELLSGV